MSESLFVLHFMLNPRTGPWNVMKRLAEAQQQSGGYAGVALGIVTDSAWPGAYEAELGAIKVPVFRHLMPRAPGTMQHLLQMVRKPPIGAWISALCGGAVGAKVIVHFHNAWTSGAFLPLPKLNCDAAAVVTFHGIASAKDLRRQPFRRLVHRSFASRLTRFGAILTSVDSVSISTANDLFFCQKMSFKLSRTAFPLAV